MRRREFLTALPVTAGLAGCLQRSAESRTPDAEATAERTSSTDTRTTATPTESATPRAGPSASVALRASYRYGVNTDGMRVEAPENDQFAFVLPPETDADRTLSDFTLRLGDREFAPKSPHWGYGSLTPGIDDVYRKDDSSGWLRFDVPTVEIDAGALVAPDSRYPLPGSVLPSFAGAPDLSLQSVSAPDSVPPDGAIELTVEATNDGDREGTFLAGFRHDGLPKTVDVPVAPGETETGSVVYDSPEDWDDEMSFVFRYPGGSDSVTVAIEADG